MNHRGMSAPERIFAFGLSPSGKSFWVKQSKDYASISGTSEVSPVHAAKIHRWWKNVLEEDAHGLAFTCHDWCPAYSWGGPFGPGRFVWKRKEIKVSHLASRLVLTY